MALDLTYELMAPQVGAAFTTVLADGSTYSLVLEACTLVEAVPGLPRVQPFTLLFLGAAGGYLPQHTARLHHDQLGELDVFIVPLGPRPGDGRQQYEAVFN